MSAKPKECVMCGSMAINPHLHGRIKGDRLELCDVCYWRRLADPYFKDKYEDIWIHQRKENK
jgi:hypothetical protein